MPLFKAAAIIAIILTLQNVVQTAVSDKQASTQQISNIEKINKVKKGTSVAKVDTTKIDSIYKNSKIVDKD